MTERELKLEAMMHLEVALDRLQEIAIHLSRFDTEWQSEAHDKSVEVDKRISAALYMVQASNGGHRPDNFENIISKARWYDAQADAMELIEFAKRGEFRGE